MSLDIRDTRTLFLKSWLLYSCYRTLPSAVSMSHIPKPPATYDYEEQQIDEYLESSGQHVVPIGELMRQVETLEKDKLPDDQLDFDELETPTSKTKQSEQEELDQLMGIQPDVLSSRYSKMKPSKKGKEKQHIVEEPIVDEAAYEESFASQQETAQLREEVDAMERRYKDLESKFDLVMRERDNLPTVINNIRNDLNVSLTEFSDKLYKVLEAQRDNKTIATTLATVDEVRAEHADQLKTAAGYLSAEPKATSPLVQKGATLKGKGKFKPIK